ncbi:MAG: type II toxin-antitoxin system RelE/ParE family toxin, partial [bacterium]|nr:type II toxin-antitoxin system RelE/ParE family toxin [bacterium]
MMKIVWTEPAVADLDTIHAYIAHDSEVYADAQIQAVFEAVDRLERFPQSGRMVPEIGQPATRELIVGSFRVIHHIADDIVRILTV